MLKQAVWLTIMCCAALAGNIAHADTPPDAKTIYRHGTAAYALGKYEEAAKEYETAFELRADPALLYNAAQAHRLAGHNARALELYTSYLRIYGSVVANRAEVQRHIANLKEALEAEQHAVSSPPTTPDPSTLPGAPLPGAMALPKPDSAPSATASTIERTPKGADLSSPAATVNAKATEPKPLIKKAWFWCAIGGGAAVVAGAVAVGVVLGRSTPNTLPIARF